MKKILKWVLIAVVALGLLGFIGFLYFIPPFTLIPPESFIKPEVDAFPTFSEITDVKERMLAEHGKYIVTTFGCTGCHTPQGDQGPAWDKLLSGGMKIYGKGHGVVVSRNLTPDKTSGLGRRTDEQVLRIFRSGLNTEGRIIFHRSMPWIGLSRLTEEDRYAVLVFLRHLKPVDRTIPDPDPTASFPDSSAVEGFYGADYSVH